MHLFFRHCQQRMNGNIADQFEKQWNFPNCIAAMDGNHILIRQPRNSGSYYFKYKGTFSIVLLALVDADYKFIYVDVECNGRVSDGGVFQNSTLSEASKKTYYTAHPQE